MIIKIKILQFGLKPTQMAGFTNSSLKARVSEGRPANGLYPKFLNMTKNLSIHGIYN